MAPPPGIGEPGTSRAGGDFPSLSPTVSFVFRSDENTRGDEKRLKLSSEMSFHSDTDILVKSGDHERGYHLAVLRFYSSYFKNIDTTQKTVDISTKNITGKTFESLYEWMIYLGRDSHKLLRRDNILEMFMAAQSLGVKELEEQSWALITDKEIFCEHSAFMLYLNARRLGQTAVKKLMVPRIQSFFLTLVSSDDWLHLKVDEVTEFLRSNYICIHCEVELFMCAARWLMYDWRQRNIDLIDVMRCVRFGAIPPGQFSVILRDPVFIEILNDPAIRRMMADGLEQSIYKSDGDKHIVKVPVNRKSAGAAKNYRGYGEFLADLQKYRNSFNKAKKSETSSEDRDSLEGVSTGEDMPPSMPGTSGVQPTPPVRPIRTMVEFIAPCGEQNAQSSSGSFVNRDPIRGGSKILRNEDTNILLTEQASYDLQQHSIKIANLTTEILALNHIIDQNNDTIHYNNEQIIKANAVVAGMFRNLSGQVKSRLALAREREASEEILRNEAVLNLKNDLMELIENELQCSICCEICLNATVLGCTHLFCNFCIVTWMKNKKECTICRAPVKDIAKVRALDSFVDTILQKCASDQVIAHRMQLTEERSMAYDETQANGGLNLPGGDPLAQPMVDNMDLQQPNIVDMNNSNRQIRVARRRMELRPGDITDYRDRLDLD